MDPPSPRVEKASDRPLRSRLNPPCRTTHRLRSIHSRAWSEACQAALLRWWLLA
ncbi:hypothetical protein CGRA01v4_05003 [Colletotrichum graminicola]|nr:hypothetical protein CGRA01v4_05003 [Colletotrichum graminicola]